MDELLRPASIVRTTKTDAGADFLRERSVQERTNTAEAKSKAEQRRTPASPEDALEILRHEPDYDSLTSVLRFLSRHEAAGSSFPTIKLPSPLSAQLVQVLVAEIVPNYWALLVEDVHQSKDSGLKLLLYCISSVAGVNAILVRLRALIQEARSEAADKARRPDISLNLGILLDLLCRVLHGDGWLLGAWRAATSGSDGPARVRPRVQEIVATFGSGRIVSLAAEADEVAKANDPRKKDEGIWPADSLQYTEWLARNIVKLALSGETADETRLASDLFAKAMRLGHPGRHHLFVALWDGALTGT
jgi:telomere length regulation protein